MEKPYEAFVVFDGMLGEDQYDKEIATVKQLLEKHATVESVDVWGKRTLAQPIDKKKTGYYCIFNFTGEGSAVHTLERALRLNTQVIRYLTLLRDPRKEEMKQRLHQQEKEKEEARQQQAETETENDTAQMNHDKEESAHV